MLGDEHQLRHDRRTARGGVPGGEPAEALATDAPAVRVRVGGVARRRRRVPGPWVGVRG